MAPANRPYDYEGDWNLPYVGPTDSEVFKEIEIRQDEQNPRKRVQNVKNPLNALRESLHRYQLGSDLAFTVGGQIELRPNYEVCVGDDGVGNSTDRETPTTQQSEPSSTPAQPNDDEYFSMPFSAPRTSTGQIEGWTAMSTPPANAEIVSSSATNDVLAKPISAPNAPVPPTATEPVEWISAVNKPLKDPEAREPGEFEFDGERGIVIRWDSRKGRDINGFAKSYRIQFPPYSDEKPWDLMCSLVKDMTPTDFGFKLLAEHFSTSFSAHESGIIDLITQSLVPTWTGPESYAGPRPEARALDGCNGLRRDEKELSERGDKFGQLVVVLPFIPFKGGDLSVHPPQKSVCGHAPVVYKNWGHFTNARPSEIRESSMSPTPEQPDSDSKSGESAPMRVFKLHWAAWHEGCKVSVAPVESGYRISLVYNLTRVRGNPLMGSTLTSRRLLDVSLLPLYTLLQKILANEKAWNEKGGYLGFMLVNAYPHASKGAEDIGFTPEASLRGVDFMMYQLIKEVFCNYEGEGNHPVPLDIQFRPVIRLTEVKRGDKTHKIEAMVNCVVKDKNFNSLLRINKNRQEKEGRENGGQKKPENDRPRKDQRQEDRREKGRLDKERLEDKRREQEEKKAEELKRRAEEQRRAEYQTRADEARRAEAWRRADQQNRARLEDEKSQALARLEEEMSNPPPNKTLKERMKSYQALNKRYKAVEEQYAAAVAGLPPPPATAQASATRPAADVSGGPEAQSATDITEEDTDADNSLLRLRGGARGSSRSHGGSRRKGSSKAKAKPKGKEKGKEKEDEGQEEEDEQDPETEPREFTVEVTQESGAPGPSRPRRVITEPGPPAAGSSRAKGKGKGKGKGKEQEVEEQEEGEQASERETEEAALDIDQENGAPGPSRPRKVIIEAGPTEGSSRDKGKGKERAEEPVRVEPSRTEGQQDENVRPLIRRVRTPPEFFRGSGGLLHPMPQIGPANRGGQRRQTPSARRELVTQTQPAQNQSQPGPSTQPRQAPSAHREPVTQREPAQDQCQPGPSTQHRQAPSVRREPVTQTQLPQSQSEPGPSTQPPNQQPEFRPTTAPAQDVPSDIDDDFIPPTIGKNYQRAVIKPYTLASNDAASIQRFLDVWSGKSTHNPNATSTAQLNASADSAERYYIDFNDVYWLNGWGHEEVSLATTMYTGEGPAPRLIKTCLAMIVKVPPGGILADGENRRLWGEKYMKGLGGEEDRGDHS
ncbi:hypothetical protein V8F20_012324 [Naviculisporaceae sp. PSN 640]